MLTPVPDLAAPAGHSYPDACKLLQVAAGQDIGVLESLAAFGYLEREHFDRVHLCACERRQYALNFREACPQCASTNIAHAEIIHHFRCGYTGAESGFLDGIRYTCPKCDTTLRHIGVDYEKVSTRWRCAACDNVFDDPQVSCRCLACDRVFPVEQTLVRTLHRYRLSARGALVAELGVIEPAATPSPIIDPELNVHTFDFFQERLLQEFAGARRYRRQLSLLAVAIDHLEAYESGYGRAAALAALRSLCRLATESLRVSDAAAVVDGKRLVLLLTDTPSSGAVIVATRLGAGVRALNQPDQAPPLTVSIGVAELEPDFAAAQALYERALDRMRAALAAGGDRVVARD